MATMFPRPLPDAARRDPRRAAEIAVYDALARLLPAEVRAFYRVAWLAKRRSHGARDGETDFLVADPARGLLVIEVKGGRIARDGTTGQWSSTDTAGKIHSIKDPSEQTRTAQYALRNKLASIPALRTATLRLARAVAFPNAADPGTPLAPDLPPEITIYGEHLPYIPEKLDAVFRFWESQERGSQAIDPHTLTVLEKVLAPTFQLPLPLGPRIADDDRCILELTPQQFEVLNCVARSRRVAVSGGAGTGKTVLAVEKAKRLAAEGYRTLLTCFNVPLASYLRDSIGAVDGLTVTHFHGLCHSLGAAAGISLPDPDGAAQPDAFYEQHLPQVLLDALDTLPDRRFDAIVVDEGQDFLPLYWEALQLALCDPDDGILHIFYDDNQSIYRGSIPSGLFDVHLSRNLRNTRAIHTIAQQYYQGAAMQAAGPPGRQVEFVQAADRVAINRRLSQIVHRLVHDDRVAPGEIAVLSGRSEARSVIGKGGTIGAFRCTRDPRGDPDAIRIDSIYRFKGLERTVVILAEIDDPVARGHRELLYVGVSRARAHLIVVGQADTLAAVRNGVLNHDTADAI